METIEVDIKTLKDLESCKWNGKFASSFIWIQIKNLDRIRIPFIKKDHIGINIKTVCARMSNFETNGRTFKVDESESMRKYDGSNGEMYFLQGIYLDTEEAPSYFLEFLEYKKGQELPTRRNFWIPKKDISISE